jgi:methionyl-tRNA synthetase
MSRILVTSALPYANGYIHLGHCAGAYLPADIFCRHKRLLGEELLYVCGSDEHGVAITIAAEQEGVEPKKIIDKYHQANKSAFDKFGMSFDIYSRTSKIIHHETAKAFFKDFLKKGYLIEKKEEQFFDPKKNIFLPDRYVEGICPNCGADGARGDQCDSCGAYYNQLELKNPKSRVSGETPIVKKTTHWYMRFDKFQSFLEEYIESHAGDWKDNVLQQTRSWLKQGLAERAITRDLSWGISINDIEEIPEENSRGKVLYVWFEAVLGYISATKELMSKLDLESKAKASDWKKWWRSEDTDYIAFIGKDNIVFHTLIFPALLHARGDNYILPKNVPANEFLNLEGQKISKSRNWTIDLQDFINDFPEPHFIDALRYALAMNFPETRDSDFTWKDFQQRNNNELSAIYGNFVNRTMTFLHKNFDGKVPELSDKYAQLQKDWETLIEAYQKNENIEHLEKDFAATYSDNDLTLVKALYSGVNKISELYGRYRFRDGITQSMNIARAANKYFNDEEPWKSMKSDREAAAKSLFVCMQLVRSLAVVFAPILPLTSEKIYKLLNEDVQTGEENLGFKTKNYWKEAALPLLEQNKGTSKPELLFTRIEDKTVEEQQAKLGTQETPEEELITIDDFMNIKLRTAVVLEAEKVKKSKKLLRLQVDLGNEKRQILAGIAEHYAPEDLVGKTVVVVANLKPAKLMGYESQGMLLAANAEDGKLAIATFENKEIGAGAEVR